MKLNLALLKKILPEYMEATPKEKPEILKKYNIARSTLYAAIERYDLKIKKTISF